MALVDAVLPYVVVFALAAVPVLEVLLVIPPAIATGLHPLLVAVAAFTGNLLGVVIVLLAGDRLRQWWRDRRPERPGRRRGGRDRALRAFERWGLPGLAGLAPLTIGSHLAVLLALSLRSSRQAVFRWFTASLVGWTAVVTVTATAGVALW